MKTALIVGTRPSFIMAKPIIDIFKKKLKNKFVLIHSGQHFSSNMDKNFFDELELSKPNYKFYNLPKKEGERLGNLIQKVSKLIVQEKISKICVLGDTDTNLAGALAGIKCNVKVFHIEAGERSYDFYSPEEMNRKMIDQISTMRLCTNLKSKNNLLKEGVENKRISIVGNPIVDTLLWATRKIKNKKNLNANIMMTLHRSETVDDFNLFKKILKCLDISLNKINKKIDYFCHPRSLKNLKKMKIKLKNINIKKPLSYLETINKLNSCEFLITDSGGLQQEAYILRKKTVTLMNSTPWPETLESGINILLKPNEINQIKMNKYLKKICFNQKKFKININLFGRMGKVSKEIFNKVYYF